LIEIKEFFMDNLLENHLPLREKIYKLIKKAILKRELKPGERITEIDLANRFGISRTPIREAFRRLESEGFLTIFPRKGATVTEINEKNVIEFYQIKGALEALAGRLALANITSEDIEEMERLNDKLKEISFSDEDTAFDEFNKIHNSFHEKFISLSGNTLLIEILRNLVKRFMRFRLMVEHTNFIDEVVKQHDEIIDAFKNKNIRLISDSIKKNAELGAQLIKKYYINKEQ
jgi:DNA-binding GntR family transcriptional regulator